MINSLFNIYQNTYPIPNEVFLVQLHPFFESLGIVTLTVFEAKLIIQNLWKTCIATLSIRLSYLHHIKETSISLWSSTGVRKKSDIELHIYADAFNAAYSAVAYFKSITSNKSVFVLSTSRSSPIKEKWLTTQLIELKATVIALKLNEKIFGIFEICTSY